MYLINIDRDKLIAAAGGDPWRVDAAIQRGRPVQIDCLAVALVQAGHCAAAAGDALSQAGETLEQGWERDDDVHFQRQLTDALLFTRSLGAGAASLLEIAAGLEVVAADLAEAQRSSAAVVSNLEKQLTQNDQGLADLIDFERCRRLTSGERSFLGLQLEGLDRMAIEDTNAALLQVHHIRDGYAETLHNAEWKLRSVDYEQMRNEPFSRPSSPTRQRGVAAIPSRANGPKAVSIWWNSLSGQEKTVLVAAHPAELGNLNGVPVDVRSEVNRAVMVDDLDRMREIADHHGVPVGELVADPGSYGVSKNELCRYANACRAEQGLAASAQAQDENGETPKPYLMRYQPEAFGGEGAAAIAMGNPDTALNTAVVVKGLGSGLRQGTLTNPDARRLFHEANCTDWHNDTAVVMWAGYDAPNSATDLRLYEPNLARIGGQALAADVNALAVTHQGPPANVTVVGHSYGSTTVADAAAEAGMHAHDIVLLGCPGTDLAGSAADFQLPAGGHLYVGDASQDEVSWFSHDNERTPVGGVGLGADPAMDGYGSTRFKAEVAGYSAKPFYDHSHYFDDGSESLFSLGDIVSGHGDALQRDHMTARHRGEYRLPAFFEPEALRQATNGHRHSAP